VWTDKISNLYNNQTAPFFDAFKSNIKIKVFDHARLVVGTPWEGDPFLGNRTLVLQHMPNMGAYSDLVRLLLLWHHGGEWVAAGAERGVSVGGRWLLMRTQIGGEEGVGAAEVGTSSVCGGGGSCCCVRPVSPQPSSSFDSHKHSSWGSRA
jgi:hypothetical protein